MRLPWMRAIASFLFSATLSAPAWANANANSAVPGTLNYVEGKVSIGEETLDSKSIGSAEVKPGQSLTTGSGKAEVLLTPGVFLRVGDNSTVTMISPGLRTRRFESKEAKRWWKSRRYIRRMIFALP